MQKKWGGGCKKKYIHRKQKGKRKVSRRGAKGERQGRERWATEDPAQKYAAADCDLDPSTMSGKDQTNIFFRAMIFNPFWEKITKSETSVF